MNHLASRCLALALAITAGCGGGKGGTGAGGSGGGQTDGWGSPVTDAFPSAVADPGQCLAFDVPDDTWGWGLYGDWTGEGLAAWMPLSVFPKHEQPSFLVVKLMAEPANWYGGPPDTLPMTVTFGPDAGAEASIDTCTVCPVLVTNVWGDNPTAVWYPIAGTLTIQQADVATREIVGALDGVVWKRVGIDGVASFSKWIVDPDPIHPEQPACAYLAHTAFDSRIAAGRPCTWAADCPNQLAQVCDVDSATCVSSECDQGKRWDPQKGDFVPTSSACPAGRVCEIALDTDDWYYGTHIEHAYTTGACVAPCDPASAAACPQGQTCEATDTVLGEPIADVCHVSAPM
jgi:hypothetical protein